MSDRKFPFVEDVEEGADATALAKEALFYFLWRCVEDKTLFDKAGYGTELFSRQVRAIAALDGKSVDELIQSVMDNIDAMRKMKKGGWLPAEDEDAGEAEL